MQCNFFYTNFVTIDFKFRPSIIKNMVWWFILTFDLLEFSSQKFFFKLISHFLFESSTYQSNRGKIDIPSEISTNFKLNDNIYNLITIFFLQRKAKNCIKYNERTSFFSGW